MQAIVFDGSTMKLQYQTDFPAPKIVNDTDVIVKVEYAGICGTDVHIIQGEFPARKDVGPLGHEFSGSIFEVGSKAVFKKGQPVVVDPNSACNLCDACRKGNYQYCTTGGLNNYIGIYRDGGWAQYCKVPQINIYPLPEGLNSKQAGLTEPFSCVYHAFRRSAPIVVGSKILILGAGIIGNIFLSALHHQGHRELTVSETNKSRLEITKKLETGCRLVSPETLAKESNEYDVIIDGTGIGKVMEISFKYLAPGGKYVVFGCAPTTDTSKVNPFDIFNKEITVIGVKINPFAFLGALSWLKAMGPRYIDYDKLGVKIFSLKDYEKAIAHLKAGSVAKAVFKI